MNNISYNDLLELLKGYSEDDIKIIEKAYLYAKALHNGQYRQSGEEYIVHPLNVAYILAELHADSDTICAGLLHDTLEDTNITKEDIYSIIDFYNYGVKDYQRIEKIMDKTNTSYILVFDKDDENYFDNHSFSRVQTSSTDFYYALLVRDGE